MTTSEDNVTQEFRRFLEEHRSLQLATVSGDGAPLASYAPFVVDTDQRFYILISDLSSHTRHLREHRMASVMLIEDETKTANIFARVRLTLTCEANEVRRDSDTWHSVIQDFHDRCGDIIETLCGLSDFHLFRLTPKSGVFVKGFGKAYKIDGEELNRISHITGTAP